MLRGLAVGGDGAKRYRVTLTVEEREALGGMISRGKAGGAGSWRTLGCCCKRMPPKADRSGRIRGSPRSGSPC